MLAILGILLYALVVPQIGSQPAGRARIVAAQEDINAGIKSAIDQFKQDNGNYPKSLQDLVQQPTDAKDWHGPYLPKLPVDSWGQKYVYEYPGKHNKSGYDLSSAGPDGKAGTDDDIGNWMN